MKENKKFPVWEMIGLIVFVGFVASTFIAILVRYVIFLLDVLGVDKALW